MDRIKKFFADFISTKNGKTAICAVGGLIVLLLVLAAATPKAVNIYNFIGNDCVNSPKSAKKIIKNKSKKEKKQ